MIPAQPISNPPLRYLFVVAGFNPISSRVASADAASIFESNSPRWVCSDNMLLNRVANRILHLDEWRASRLDGFLRKHPRGLQLDEDSAWLRIRHTPIRIPISHVSQPGAKTLLSGGNRTPSRPRVLA